MRCAKNGPLSAPQFPEISAERLLELRSKAAAAAELKTAEFRAGIWCGHAYI
jgi:hypothetical protein